ncbi:hypothetical protein [Parvularcula sp. LCG005]|uniref:hypothetical protein n=1 Tax=Parvularcula sp. LCG005 TaxID=3078805 RepID=UPI0029425260|nr:hypothetical protein [Parvularcula sp. LCG005]WOI53097.1 hypothetical protein RUI03_13175 [Parvularcula sp. LCG005]
MDLQNLLTRGTLIRVMGAIAGLWIVIILVIASQSPDTAAVSAGGDVRPPKGFELAFPPRPVPAMTLTDGDRAVSLRSLAGQRLLVQFSPSPCEGCEEAGRDLLDLRQTFDQDALRVAVVTQIRPAAPVFGTFHDADGQMTTYIGRNAAKPVTILYDPTANCEIGRIVGVVDWQSEAVKRFLSASLTEAGCR